MWSARARARACEERRCAPAPPQLQRYDTAPSPLVLSRAVHVCCASVATSGLRALVGTTPAHRQAQGDRRMVVRTRLSAAVRATRRRPDHGRRSFGMDPSCHPRGRPTAAALRPRRPRPRPRLRGPGSLRRPRPRRRRRPRGRALRAAAAPAEGWGGPWCSVWLSECNASRTWFLGSQLQLIYFRKYTTNHGHTDSSNALQPEREPE